MQQSVDIREPSRNKRNETLALIKLFASYMVVFTHVMFYGAVGTVVDSLSRFAVPLFFLTAGFYSQPDNPEKTKKKIVRLSKLLAFASLTYIILGLLSFLICGDVNTVIEYVKGVCNLHTLLYLIVFNLPVSSVHLWFLLALIYVYALQYLVHKFHVPEKVILAFSLACLLLHLLLGEVFTAFHIAIPIVVVRNFLLMGVPFFTLGFFAQKYKERLKAIKNRFLILSIIIGIAETVTSRMLSGKNELYLGSLFVLFSMVVFFIKYGDRKYGKLLSVLASCSTYIYIFHMIVKFALNALLVALNAQPASPLFQMLMPILVCIVSTLLALCINHIAKQTRLLLKKART